MEDLTKCFLQASCDSLDSLEAMTKIFLKPYFYMKATEHLCLFYTKKIASS